jgi:hypothetical protein
MALLYGSTAARTRSPQRHGCPTAKVHDMTGKFSAFYPNHEDAWFIAKQLHDTQCYLRMRLVIYSTIHIHNKTRKFEWIHYQAFENFKNL